MSKILILTTHYLNGATANGICARNIANELKKMGHEISVCCYSNSIKEDVIENIKIYPMQYNYQETTHQKKIDKIFSFIYKCYKPKINNKLVEFYYSVIKKVYTEDKIKIILAISFPIESVVALYIAKKDFKELKALVYELDSVQDGINNKGVGKIYNIAYIRWLKKIYKKIDTIFIMQSHKESWEKDFLKKYGNKEKITDLPVLLNKKRNIQNNKNRHITFIYSGLLEKKYRSPRRLFDVLQYLNKSLSFTFKFFTKGDCEEEIKKMSSFIPEIIQKGYVEQDLLEKEILDSDILVSIGNSWSKSVPSKIISYLSYGKPIIHFSLQKQDICCEYLNRYQLSLVIPIELSVEETVERIKEFVKNKNISNISYEILEKEFEKNTPRYSAQLIDSLL